MRTHVTTPILRRGAASWIVIGLLAGCTDLPPLDHTLDAAAKSAPYPDLVPADPLLARAAQQRIEEGEDRALDARAAALRARAARLRRQ